MNWKQAPSTIFMVKPASFTFNSETASSNTFQQPVTERAEVGLLAQKEFDAMIEQLRSNQIDVHIFIDTPLPLKPDALFPNNWISIHESGQIVLYPMLALNRRLERRVDIVDYFKTHFHIKEVIDFSSQEDHGIFMEGTGSVVFDHTNLLAYACRSPRTDTILLEEICNKLGYKSIVFDAVDESGMQIYHTNVMMCVGSRFVVLCLDSILKEEDQEELLNKFKETGHQVIAISFIQLNSFAGNMLEVENVKGETFVIMSRQALDSLLPGQVSAISKFATIIPIAIPTIEKFGGGSVRCMMAGVHARRQLQ